MKPDPKCKECNGTGLITLFTSTIKCRCLKISTDMNDSDDNIFEDESGYWE